MQKKELLSKKCKWCGKMFLSPPYRRGYFCSQACSAKGRKMREIVYVQYTCKCCGKECKKPKYNTDSTTKFCSLQCLANVRGQNMRGPLHPKWKGGDNRSGSHTVCKKIKEQTGKCEKCGKKDSLEIHHKIPVNERPDLAAIPDNVEILCKKCHAKEHPGFEGMMLKQKFGMNKVCDNCKKSFYVPQNKKNQKFCSRKCYRREV